MRVTEQEYQQLMSGRREPQAAIEKTIEQAPKKSVAAGVIRSGKVTRLELMLPIKVISEANTASSEHWARRHKRNKLQQAALTRGWSELSGGIKIIPPVTIRLTRFGKRKTDSDNLPSAFKHIQDAIARIIGIDDGSDLLTWEYHQVTGQQEYSIKVEFVCA